MGEMNGLFSSMNGPLFLFLLFRPTIAQRHLFEKRRLVEGRGRSPSDSGIDLVLFAYRSNGTAYQAIGEDVVLSGEIQHGRITIHSPLPCCCYSHVVVIVGTCFVVGAG